MVILREPVPGDVLQGLLGPARHVGFGRPRYVYVIVNLNRKWNSFTDAYNSAIKPNHAPTVLVRSPTFWLFMICADVYLDHCLNCIYRPGAGNENTTSTPEKRHSRIRQIQSNRARPSPWPGVNQPDQLSQERCSPDSVVEGSPHIGDKANATTTPQAETPPCDSASKDGLSGINLHTNGTEFYGNSSNLAFLGNLYARARNQAENRTNTSENGVYPPPASASQPTTSEPNQTLDNKDAEKATSDKAQLSIVNLLYNPNYPSHSLSSQSTLAFGQDRKRRNVQVDHNPGASTGNIIIGQLK